jgi:hypothetical protein
VEQPGNFHTGIPVKANHYPVPPTSLPLPAIPWQITGNHWLALPCIHPATGAVQAVGMLHRGTRSAVEFAGDAGFVDGRGPALLRPVVSVDGVVHEFASGQMAWERALGWLPTFTCQLESVVVRGTVFAPFGRDADVAGAVYAISVENRSSAPHDVRVAMAGTLGHRQLRVRTPRAFDDAHRVVADGDVVLLSGTTEPGLAVLAVGAEEGTTIEVQGAGAPGFRLTREFRLEAGAREQAAFYLAAGPEGDGAKASVRVLRRRGWRDLLAGTRDALQALGQSTGLEAMDRLINHNLLFAYFYGVGRALDDAQFYLMRTRIPWHAAGVTVHDWETLMWTVQAVQLADPPLARELILRVCELHGYAPGRGINYLDGTLFEAGFTLEGAAAYPLAVDRYLRDTEDSHMVEEPVIGETLYAAHDEISARRDAEWPLYGAELGPSGRVPSHAFALHGNAVVAQALYVLRQTLDEATAHDVQDPAVVRAAITRHFLKPREGGGVFASAIDMTGEASMDDDPVGSTCWLPLYDLVERNDSNYRRTVKAMDGDSAPLVQRCARLVGPEAAAALRWFRQAPLAGGLAAELVDAEGRAIANGGDASLSGLLAWSVWYAVHVLGERP